MKVFYDCELVLSFTSLCDLCSLVFGSGLPQLHSHSNMPCQSDFESSTGSAQFQSCHDATGCGGSEVTGVSNASDCCLGSGLSFRNSGTCRQCIGKQLHATCYTDPFSFR